jgi:hypothetical protein
VVNTWGDGLLAEFPSVVEAVRTGIDVQNELAEHNAGKPTATRMLFRIGINLGDVIVEGDDLYGDGVNIAARLQAQAAPGGIVISNTVYDQVRNKVGVGFEFLGNLSVKNIQEGVPSYAVRIGSAETDAAPRPEQNFGRNPQPPRPDVPRAAAASGIAIRGWHPDRKIGVLAVIGLGLVAINVLTWSDTFWAAWPLLAFAVIAGLDWAKSVTHVDRGLATLGVLGIGIVGINLLSGIDSFWAKWPLLAFAIVGGVRWFMRRGARDGTAH